MREPRTWKKTNSNRNGTLMQKRNSTHLYIYAPHTYKKGEFVRNNKEERHQSQELMMG